MTANADNGRVKRWRELLASERDAAALYGRIAEIETGERRKIFEELADVERRHAAHWEDALRGAGAAVPPPGRPSVRTRLLGLGARRLSTSAASTASSPAARLCPRHAPTIATAKQARMVPRLAYPCSAR